VFQRFDGDDSTWQAHYEFVAETPQCVVEAFVDVDERQVGELRELRLKESANERLVNGDLGGGPRHAVRLQRMSD
jgi:hypothetical protein